MGKGKGERKRKKVWKLGGCQLKCVAVGSTEYTLRPLSSAPLDLKKKIIIPITKGSWYLFEQCDKPAGHK